VNEVLLLIIQFCEDRQQIDIETNIVYLYFAMPTLVDVQVEENESEEEILFSQLRNELNSPEKMSMASKLFNILFGNTQGQNSSKLGVTLKSNDIVEAQEKDDSIDMLFNSIGDINESGNNVGVNMVVQKQSLTCTSVIPREKNAVEHASVIEVVKPPIKKHYLSFQVSCH